MPSMPVGFILITDVLQRSILVDGKNMTVVFYRSPDRRGRYTTTICTISKEVGEDNEAPVSASANLHWRDKFDEKVGRAQALAHALRIMKAPREMRASIASQLSELLPS